MNLSFAGCGFLGIYHVGVAVCFKKYAPHLLLNKISGASAGAIAACCLLCDLPIGEVASDMLSLIREARLRTLGPFSPNFNVQEFLLDRLRKVLPEDAHLRVNGKLHVSLTRVYDGKNVIVSHFTSKEDLLQALLASAFVPVFSGFLPPKFHGERYMDGGFSDNLPTLDENTITVSPFCGETDICPRDFSSQLFHVNLANTSIELSKQNIYRFARILWPPKPEVLSNMCKQGFDDALRFLHRNNLINCTRCLAVQSTFIESEMGDDCLEYDPQCQECKLHRQEALVANLPDTVMRVFQEAIDTANKGFYNWVLSHQGMKLITLLGLPYTIPADFAYATLKKLVMLAPHMSSSLIVMSKFFVGKLAHFMQTFGSRTLDHYPTSNYLMEYSTLSYDQEFVHENEMNISFQINLEDNNMEPPSILNNDLLSRRNSLKVSPEAYGIYADDTFENILEVTSHHDAIMAFYYMDDNNKVKVTEIFDVTGNDALGSENSCTEVVQDDWDEPLAKSWLTQEKEDSYYKDEENSITDNSLDDECTEPGNIFSDPESEWVSHEGRGNNVLRVNELPLLLPDLRPECEQIHLPKKTVHD